VTISIALDSPSGAPSTASTTAAGRNRCGTEERRAPTRVGDEAHVLAVGLGGGAQAQRGGAFAHLGLGEVPDGEQRAGQFALRQHVHHVALVLRGVGAAGDVYAPSCVTMRAWCPVATASKPSRSARSLSRWNLRWRLHSMQGLGVMPCLVRIDVGSHDVLVEVVGEVEHQVVDAELLRDPASVVDVGDAAAAGVAARRPTAAS
jgi:hypothetical protein